jgi:hypothetical protein
LVVVVVVGGGKGKPFWANRLGHHRADLHSYNQQVQSMINSVPSSTTGTRLYPASCVSFKSKPRIGYILVS